MTADKDHTHDSDAQSDHHPAATDIIPENSPQDQVLKVVTVIGATLIVGTFFWWWAQPLSQIVESHGGAEGTQH